MGPIMEASYFSFIYNFGSLKNNEWNIIIHKEHEPDDFNAVSKWIESIKDDK
jgi:hypothetical protein